MSNPQRETIEHLVHAGHSFSQISKELQVEKGDLQQLFKGYGLPTPLAYARSLLTPEFIAQCIQDGQSLKQISARVRLDYRYVKRIMDSLGLQTDQQRHYAELQTLRASELSSATKGAIVGTLLGDASISMQHAYGTAAVLSFKHSVLQGRYAEYKAKVLLSEIFHQEQPTVVPEQRTVIQGVSTVQHEQHKWSSVAHNYLEWLRATMYGPSGVKRVVWEVLDDLTLLGAALWFADDGSTGNNKTYRIHTNGFDLESVKLLRRWLYDRLKIKVTIINAHGYELYVPRASVFAFERYIGSYVLQFPDVQYKIKGFDYKDPQRLYVKNTL